MFDFSNYLTKSKYYNDSNKLVIWRMKDETGSVVIGDFVGLESKMCSFLVDDNSEHKKAKCAYKNIVATLSHNRYKDVLLNNKCIRHSIYRTQSKSHIIRTYEINKISLPCFNDNISETMDMAD